MKSSLFYLVLVFNLIACNTPSEPTPSKPISPNVSSSINYTSIHDSLVAYKDSLEAALTLVSQNFEFKKQDLASPSYYHQNWGGQYYIADEAILAAVDSTGTLTIILNVWVYSHRETDLNTLTIQIDTSIYHASSDTSFSYAKPLSVICACGFHQAFFRDQSAQTIAKTIALSTDYSVNWVGIKKLSKRDIIGIRESWHLSNLLKQLYSTQQQIAAIQDKL
jgi:hypothetical protein